MASRTWPPVLPPPTLTCHPSGAVTSDHLGCVHGSEASHRSPGERITQGWGCQEGSLGHASPGAEDQIRLLRDPNQMSALLFQPGWGRASQKWVQDQALASARARKKAKKAKKAHDSVGFSIELDLFNLKTDLIFQ